MYSDEFLNAYHAARSLFGDDRVTLDSAASFPSILRIYDDEYRQEKDSHSSLVIYTQELRLERATLRQENEVLKAEIESLRAQLLDSNQQKEAMRFKVAKLEDSRDNNKPLVQIGTAIRLRCLEQARLKVEACDQNRLDSVRIENGNIAAHHGNGDADAALLQSSFLQGGAHAKFSRIFLKMYQLEASAWKSSPLKLKDALNCIATLNALKAFDRIPASAECQPIIDHVDAIRTKHVKLSEEELEKDDDVNRKLEFAKSLTAEIVKKGRQRQSNKGTTNRSTVYRSSPSKDTGPKFDDGVPW